VSASAKRGLPLQARRALVFAAKPQTWLCAALGYNQRCVGRRRSQNATGMKLKTLQAVGFPGTGISSGNNCEMEPVFSGMLNDHGQRGRT
jgi:hypothetical protein